MNYKVRYLDDNNAEVVFVKGDGIETAPIGNVSGLTADKVNELALQVVNANTKDLPTNTKVDICGDMKADIDLARTQMRKIMKVMASKDLSVSDKNELVDICKVEIASAITLGKLIKQRIDIENYYGLDKEYEK